MHLIHSILAILAAMSPYILLGFLIAGLLHAFVPAATMSRHLSGRGWRPVLKAALFGVPLPLCSCGVLPTAVALRRSGASRGATTSFLIATPQTGVDSIAATWSLLGLPMAILRPLAALAGAMIGGVAVDRFAGSEDDVIAPLRQAAEKSSTRTFSAKLAQAVHYGFVDMVASVGKWLVIGLLVAALITVFVPEDLFVSLSRYPLLAMLAVVVVAIPMYVCATGSIPIALSLMMKGLSPGIAFVMLMAGPAANFASLLLLSRAQGRRATAIYVASVVVTAIAAGLVIDYLLPASWFMPQIAGHGAHAHAHSGIFSAVCSGVLIALLAYAAISQHFFRKSKINNTDTDMETITLKVKGMACPHCKASVEKAVAAVEGVEAVEASLADACATVRGTANVADLQKAIEAAGFEVVN